MIKKIKVAVKGMPYFVYIGNGALKELPGLIKKTDIGQDVVLITTPNLAKIYGERLKALLRKSCSGILALTIPDSEKSKSAGIAFDLIEKITKFDTKKKIFLAAFGGGVVGDLTGFIAAIYKRGVPYIQIPCSLLAQIDSSIGGKTAVDTAFGKNLVGAFYQPRFVLADTGLLKTLPAGQIRAGLSEALKYAVIKDSKLFEFFRKNLRKIKALDPEAINTVILRCAGLKASIVAVDEFDKRGVRIILNFGHTFGHAVEAASNYKISHGEAVAIGIVAACRLSCRLGLLDEKIASEISGIIRTIGLPAKIKGIRPDNVLSALKHDKKFTHGKNRFVLLEAIGKTKIVENIPERLLKEVIEGLY
ncbi:MAG TPA: 3-dehydroquinate synthase [Candidatus Omnitrophica bacterium]|nr:3-dehydroquinate synthase [Candidatus Omnitrophota bacterium]